MLQMVDNSSKAGAAARRGFLSRTLQVCELCCRGDEQQWMHSASSPPVFFSWAFRHSAPLLNLVSHDHLRGGRLLALLCAGEKHEGQSQRMNTPP
ncbi:hypothetical protein OJAV_G00007870 [Oryzias javanicus]|uniref:Uncharacterized protein n=1 Tax=Oryzias javanicus TaxID=123683 RepID=A0A3S2UR09_ORYJA|nr:hypothetical protein OJAV_G00007870 [Oryzias javanicus]